MNQPYKYAEIYGQYNLNVPQSLDLGQNIANVLTRIVKANDCVEPPRTIFHSKNIPGISLHNYINRLTHYSKCSPETLVIALIYVEKYITKQNDELFSRNVHKLFFIGMVVAAKFNDDLKLANDSFAKLGGMSKLDLCILETQFLKDIDFEVYVSSSDFLNYFRNVIQFAS